MKAEWVEHFPRVRCAECGKPDVVAVCHHCGTPMCSEHRLRRRFAALDNLFNSEHSGLELGEDEQSKIVPTHCDSCRHLVLSGYLLVGLGLLLGGFVGLALLIWLPLSQSAVAGAGILVFYLVAYARWRRGESRFRPPVPVAPTMESIKIIESFEGRVEGQPGGGCIQEVSSAKAIVSVRANFTGQDRRRMKHYASKYGMHQGREMPVHAGFLILKGMPTIVPAREHSLVHPLVIPLIWVLQSTHQEPSGEVRLDWEYQIREGRRKIRFPVRVVPALGKRAGGRELEFEVQYPKMEPDERSLAAKSIEILELRVPAAEPGFWGNIRGGEPAPEVAWSQDEQTGRAFTVIRWKSRPLNEMEQRRTFLVEFDDPIDLQGRLQGRVELLFEQALSGLDGCDLYSPAGSLIRDARPEISTLVALEFDLSLDSLCDQGTSRLPSSHDEYARTLAGCSLDAAKVLTVLDSIAELDGYYIKWAVEAGLSQWDIGGSYYEGMVSVGFHLVLYGQPAKFTLAANGAMAGSDGREVVERVWRQLHETVVDTVMRT